MEKPASAPATGTGLAALQAAPVQGAGENLGWTVAFVATATLFLTIIQVTIGFAIGSVNDRSDLTLHSYLSWAGPSFGRTFGFALVMLAIIETVRRRGPGDGVRRVIAVALAVVAAALAAASLHTLWWAAGSGPNDSPMQEVFLPDLPRFLAVASLLTAVGEFYRAELRSIETMRAAESQRAALEQQSLQARLKTLEAQIEPHFLFNTLANVRRLYETDIDAGEAMLGRLMRYLQVALPSMREDHSTLGREGQLIRAYLELQQVRMGRRLAFDIDIAPSLHDIEVPPMMLLTLVENAIKHGLAPQREGGRVDVVARLEGSEIRLEVADTGRGFGGDTAGGGTGLANIRARLGALFGQAAELTLAAREPRGLRATIRMPAGGRAAIA